MELTNQKIKKIHDFLSNLSKRAYSDPLLIANDVLCKQDTRGRIIENYLSGATPQKITFLALIKKTLLYFAKNLVAFVLYLLTALCYRFSRQVFQLPENGELLILDSVVVIRRIIKENKFIDEFFPALEGVLIKGGKQYVYVPRFFGTMRPYEWFRVFRILEKNSDPVMTEFQLLGFFDYLKIFRFIFIYPISVWRFAKNLGTSYEDKIVCHALWQAFDSVAFGAYGRFLLGKQLSCLKVDKIKCLSWYENQIFEKNFYRGLRFISDKVDIIGAQLFVRPHTLLNIIPDEGEISFDVVPDRILVNGSGYLPKLSTLSVDIGPALRYAHLFNTKAHPSEGKVILILMPFWDNVIKHILKVIQEVDWPVPVEIKFHPSTNKKTYRSDLPRRYFVTDKKLPELLSRARIVVGCSSGSLLEAAALGIPVINIQNPDEFSHNYMTEIGKGVLWDNAVGAREVTQLVRQFQEALQLHPCRLQKEGDCLRSTFFSESTNELIGQAFGLD